MRQTGVQAALGLQRGSNGHGAQFKWLNPKMVVNAKTPRGKGATDVNHGWHGWHGYEESVSSV